MKTETHCTKKLFILNLFVALFLGFLICLYWVHIGETDELCELRHDGSGWMKLSIHNDYVYCVPNVKFFLFATTLYGLGLALPIFPFVYLLYFTVSSIRKQLMLKKSSR